MKNDWEENKYPQIHNDINYTYKTMEIEKLPLVKYHSNYYFIQKPLIINGC